MIWLALVATWWAGVGLVVGANRSRILPGPTDGLSFAAWWALVWPALWLMEASYGE
jgi:hypothetical protein